MALILYGAPVREKIKEELRERIKKLGRRPVLVILQVGDREDSNVYVRQKQKFGEEIGAEVILKKFKDFKVEDLQGEIGQEIERLNNDEKVDGMIVQLPLPAGVETEKILKLIGLEKDADGLSSPLVTPATARGVMTLLDYYAVDLKNKTATVIGQSALAGRPISLELEKRGVQVTRCDIQTQNIPEKARESDILVVAVGKMGLVDKSYVNKNQVVVDVGINKNSSLKLVGDVNFAEVEPLVKAITPVPGGVGPLTVACLFQNLLDLS